MSSLIAVSTMWRHIFMKCSEVGKHPCSNHLGNISLCIAIGGLLVMITLTHGGIWNSFLAQLLLMGFEAGTVGALADFYAVSALFHHLGPHSDILRKNRGKIEDKIIDLVEKDWLSKDSLKDHIEKLNPSKFMTGWLDKPHNHLQALGIVKKGAGYVVPELDNPSLIDAFERIIREKVSEVDISRPLGRWLSSTIEKGDHNDLWNAVLEAVAKEAGNAETQQLLSRIIRQAVTGYLPTILKQLDRPELKDYVQNQVKAKLNEFDMPKAIGSWLLHEIEQEGHNLLFDAIISQFDGKIEPSPEVQTLVKKIFTDALTQYTARANIIQKVGLAIGVWSINEEMLKSAFHQALSSKITEIKRNGNHPIRHEFGAFLRKYGERLKSGDPSAVSAINSMKSRLMESDWTQLINQTIDWVKKTIEEETVSDSSNLRLIDYDRIAETMSGIISGLALEIKSKPDHALRSKMDGLIRNFAKRLADGDPEATSTLDRLKSSVLETADINGILKSLLSGLKEEMGKQLTDPDSVLSNSIEKLVTDFSNQLKNNDPSRSSFDSWIRKTLIDIVDENHHKIVELVRYNLVKLDDDQFVKQVKDNTWEDLQYIRLNGAVVGFFVGCIIAVLKEIIP